MRGMILLAALLLVAQAALSERAGAGDAPAERVTYRDAGDQLDLVGELALPANRDGRLSAMIIVHGSSGPSRREAEWAGFLRANGFATLAIDYFGPRGINSRSPQQPTPVGDVTQAIARLAAHPRIDPARIGVIGFSRGAVMAIAAANDRAVHGAVHIALYPGCRRLTIEPDPALPPVLVLIGTEDSYSTADECRWMVGTATGRGRTAEIHVYEGATHAWDGGKDANFYHEAAKRSVTIRASDEFTERSHTEVLAFLRRFGME